MTHPLGDPDKRWQVEAMLRQALYDLERGGHVALVVSQLRRSLDEAVGGAAAHSEAVAALDHVEALCASSTTGMVAVSALGAVRRPQRQA